MMKTSNDCSYILKCAGCRKHQNSQPKLLQQASSPRNHQRIGDDAEQREKHRLLQSRRQFEQVGARATTPRPLGENPPRLTARYARSSGDGAKRHSLPSFTILFYVRAAAQDERGGAGARPGGAGDPLRP
ncbi:hypothetical protein EVAR_84098_1 [Eumeta japonica]|uniref:Uncharacterized protein n=1 Tax=Eumeta variegata TaxID=151549 RepID=A0A4C1V0C4_EUMVA|nr:hypothetical protein EVAR_84098_1 [Eumeta japonica]